MIATNRLQHKHEYKSPAKLCRVCYTDRIGKVSLIYENTQLIISRDDPRGLGTSTVQDGDGSQRFDGRPDKRRDTCSGRETIDL